MANYKIGVDFEADGSKAVQAINQVASAMQNLQSQTSRTSNSLETNISKSLQVISSKLASFGATMSATLSAPLILLGKSLFDSASKIEQTAISLEVFTGSAETAKRLMQEFKDVAVKSPLQFQDINNGAKILMGYGVTANQVTPIIKMLGDISGGNADKFNRLALAFGQVNAAGRLMGQENRQMINAGFNPLLAISEKTGESMASLTQRMHDGRISVQEVADAFYYATSEGGRFNGMAEKQAETLGGLWNKLSETVSLALADIGISLAKNAGIKKWFDGLIVAVTKIRDTFLNLSPSTQEFILKAGALVAIIGPLTLGLAAITSAVGTLTAAFVALNLSTGGVLLLAGLLATSIAGIGIFMTETSKSVNKLNTSLNDSQKVAQGFSLSPISSQITQLESEINSLEKSIQNNSFLSSGIGKMKGIDEVNNAQVKKLKALKAELQNLKDIQQKNLGFSTTGKATEDKLTKSEINRIEELKKKAKEGYTKLSEMYRAYSMSKTDIMEQEAKQELEVYKKYGIDTKNVLLSQFNEKQRVAREETAKLTYLVNKTLTVKNIKDSLKRMIDDQTKNLESVRGAMENSLKNLNQTMTKNMNFGQAFEYVFSSNYDGLTNMGATFVDRLNDTKEAMKSALLDFRTTMVVGMAEIVGNLMVGVNSFSDSIAMVGSLLANTLGDLLIKVGTTVISTGKALTTIVNALKKAITSPTGLIVAGGLALVAGFALKAVAGKTNNAISNSNKSLGVSDNTSSRTAGMTTGANYQYGGANYSQQTIRLAIDLTGAITASPSGYNINKSLETVLRVTGR